MIHYRRLIDVLDDHIAGVGIEECVILGGSEMW